MGASSSVFCASDICLPVLAGVAVCADDGEGSVGEELRSGVVCDGEGRVNVAFGLNSGVMGSIATDGAGTKG